MASRLPVSQSRGPDEAQVIVPSALRLTRQQEDDLLRHIKTRKDNLEGDLGRTNYNSPDFFTAADRSALKQSCISFMGRQHLGHLVFQGQMDWRAALIGGLYEQTNIHFPLTRRILLQQIARAIEFVTGTTPWFTAYDVGISDEELAQKIERFVLYRADRSSLEETINQAIACAFIQGQAVVKTTHEKITDYYESYATIAHDAAGQPIQAGDGDYIFETDTFVLSADAAALAAQAEQQGFHTPNSQDMVLKRDMQTPQPEVMTFKKVLIQRSMVHFNGARSAVVPFLDFLCPLTATDVQKADIVIHIFNEPLIRVLQRFLMLEMAGAENAELSSPEKQLERLAEMMNALMPGTATDSLGGQHLARPELREADNTTGVDTIEPMGSFCETYLHYDANGDGIQESILVITDEACKVVLFYDYLANVTPNGQRPFNVVRVNPVTNRWHGQSQVETFYNLQETIDLMVNRMHLRMTSAGRVDFWNPHLTVEGQNPQQRGLQLNRGTTYTAINAETDVTKILHSVYLNDMTYDMIKDFVELLIQIAINMSGVSNVNDGQMANLDTQKLATGIRNMEASGQELFGVHIASLRPGVRATVLDFAAVTLINLDQPEAFKFFEGDVGRLAEITPQEVRNLRLDVDISLSRYRSQQEAAQGQQALSVVQWFYALPYAVQVLVAPLARNLLRAYQQKQADEYIQPVQLQPMLPEAAGAAPPPL